MPNKWDTPKVFERESNIYIFSQNPLLRKNKDLQLFMPWDERFDEELMFKIKAKIVDNGHVNLPFMQKNGKPASLSLDEVARINAQLEAQRETHLIMSNLDSIHVFRITKIINEKEALGDEENSYCPKKLRKTAFKSWIQVDDLFVLEANHDKNDESIADQLNNFITNIQTQSVFKPNKKQLSDDATGEINLGDRERWVDANRSLTYDYFIRSCELKDNIYQDNWDYLSRKTQHELITSDLERNTGIFYRKNEKWNYLKKSFDAYLSALYNELNEVYIFPLVNAITDYHSLKEAWFGLDDNLVNARVKKIIQELLVGEKERVDNLDEFLFYTKSAKSFLFTLKQKFTKKIHKEEFLLVENFLCRQESLIESLICHKIVDKIHSIIKIQQWIKEVEENSNNVSSTTLKDCNLKLSHLLSIMASASYDHNIFFKLIEEKAARGISKKSFEDEVNNLISIELKKSA